MKKINTYLKNILMWIFLAAISFTLTIGAFVLASEQHYRINKGEVIINE